MNTQDASISQRFRAAIACLRGQVTVHDNVPNVVELDVFQCLRIAISKGTAKEEFPIYTVLPDVWTNPLADVEQKMSHFIKDYRMVKLADGREVMGAVLCRVHTIQMPDCFDRRTHWFCGVSLMEYMNSDSSKHDKPYGYLAGCSKELRNAIAEVEVDYYNPYDYYDDPPKVCGKVFISDPKDLCIVKLGRTQREQRVFSEFRKSAYEMFTQRQLLENGHYTILDLNDKDLHVLTWTRKGGIKYGYLIPNGYFCNFVGKIDGFGVLATSVVVGADVEM